jgi:dihydrofolate synthase/folylpolyglutamate synthase
MGGELHTLLWLHAVQHSLPRLMNRLQSAHMSASYQEALDYLYGFVNFEHRRLDRYSPENISLDRAQDFLELLGDPQIKYPTIHIAGTKGKGSVAAMCAFSLRAAGLKCALYTSPHLQDFRDRIRILTSDDEDGRIPKDTFANLVERIKLVSEQVDDLTWYELVTAIAFLHFAEEAVDIAVIEVGLGGRLDATNVLTPLVSIITSLSLDHTYLLGNSLAEIAVEKAGIIKVGVPVISAPQESEGLSEIEQIALEKQAPLTVIGREWQYAALERELDQDLVAGPIDQRIIITKSPDSTWAGEGSIFTLALIGRHQQDNALLAIATLDLVSGVFPELTKECVEHGLANLYWPGRMQILAQDSVNPALLVDCAHNVDSARKLASTLQNDFHYEHLVLIIGTTADKDVAGILKVLLPLSDHALLTSSGHPRASSPGELLKMTTEMGFECSAHANVVEALRAARKLTSAGDLVCVTGSIFVVGDLLNQWESLKSQLWLEQ